MGFPHIFWESARGLYTVGLSYDIKTNITYGLCDGIGKDHLEDLRQCGQ